MSLGSMARRAGTPPAGGEATGAQSKSRSPGGGGTALYRYVATGPPLKQFANQFRTIGIPILRIKLGVLGPVSGVLPLPTLRVAETSCEFAKSDSRAV